MKKILTVTFMLWTACNVLAQNHAGKPTPGEPPSEVRNNKAVQAGHFNSQQTLRLAFGLKPPHPQEEEEFLAQLMTPGSPQFHKFLTPSEWNARFSPSAQDEQAVVDWAKSQGMAITHRYPNRLIVDAEATAGTIEKALQVTINNYRFEGDVYFSNEREPAIPAALANIVHSVGGLHNFSPMRPAAFHDKQSPGPVYSPGPVIGMSTTHKGNADVEGRPGNSSRHNGPNITNGFYDPTDIFNSNAYNYDGLQNFGFCCNPFHAGGGSPPESSIALATFGNLHWDGTHFTDVLGFHNQYPYLAYNVTTIPINGGPSNCTVGPNQPCNNDGETALDAEWSTATANSFGSFNDTAHVYVYQSSGSAEDMYNAMLNDGFARIFSTSWSCTENAGCASGSDMDTRHNIFNQMVGQGWTLMTASGDRGATDDCSSTNVSYPASDPDVIGVGGTLLSLFSNGTYNSEVAWQGGTSSKSCANNNGGSGGGCSVHFAAPNFQSNQPCGAGSRSVPDISLNAAAGQNFFFNGSLSGVGGTSISSPMLAGFFAQEGAYLLYIKNLTGNDCGSFHVACGPMGNGNTYLYYFGLNPNYAPHFPFYDITSGCNSNDITAGNNTLTFYCAGTGYDSVTGWGTANMLQLAWAINTYIAGDFVAPSVNFGGATTNHYYNTPQSVNWTLSDVSGNGAVPAGVAGFTRAWDTVLSDASSETTPGSGDSFYSGPQFPLATSGSLTLDNNHEGCHSVHVRSWDNTGATSDHTRGPLCFDDIPPVVNCGSPDGLWHAADVSIHCSAGDSLSGLANSADASFNLTTSVAAGTETANAFTNSRTVFDVAGNSTTRGPIGPNMVDKKAPVIVINQPTATQYTHSSALTLNYSVTDGGSGVGTVTSTMNGNTTVNGAGLSSGTVINLLTGLPLGPNTFAVNAADKVGNTSSASVTFTIIVTAQSIIDDIHQFQMSGDISSAGVASGLLQKLNAALTARNNAQCGTAANIYSAFINQVMAQTGKGITAKAAAILIADAQYLIAHCP